jgi:hypothetical protein
VDAGLRGELVEDLRQHGLQVCGGGYAQRLLCLRCESAKDEGSESDESASAKHGSP